MMEENNLVKNIKCERDVILKMTNQTDFKSIILHTYNIVIILKIDVTSKYEYLLQRYIGTYNECYRIQCQPITTGII